MTTRIRTTRTVFASLLLAGPAWVAASPQDPPVPTPEEDHCCAPAFYDEPVGSCGLVCSTACQGDIHDYDDAWDLWCDDIWEVAWGALSPVDCEYSESLTCAPSWADLTQNKYKCTSYPCAPCVHGGAAIGTSSTASRSAP